MGDGMSGVAAVLHMGLMGLIVAAGAPVLVLLGRGRWWDLDQLALPGVVVLPGFLALHALITLGVEGSPGSGPVLGALVGAVLLIASVSFWLPVLGRRRRLPDPLRSAYLFLAGPVLDLPAVWLVARGEVAEGLAMIVGMLPLGVAAIAVTWRWITQEEHAAEVSDHEQRVARRRASAAAAPSGPPSPPDASRDGSRHGRGEMD